ncbi:hypothetical protein Aduo_004970 [Ancylostoma duodenale]
MENTDNSESLTGDEPPPMASSVTIRVDDTTEDEKEAEKGNGHLTRADGSFRRGTSTRRSRSTPAIDITAIEEAPGISRVRKLRSMDSIMKLFTKGSRRSHGPPPKEHEPGLRSMLYGLHQKLEREEAAMKKRQRKQHSMFPFLVFQS